jgi:hypothetical protein
LEERVIFNNANEVKRYLRERGCRERVSVSGERSIFSGEYRLTVRLLDNPKAGIVKWVRYYIGPHDPERPPVTVEFLPGQEIAGAAWLARLEAVQELLRGTNASVIH